MIDSLNLKSVSISEESFSNSIRLLKQGLKDQVAPGFVIGLWQKKEPDTIYIGAYGNRKNIPSVLPVFENTIFDLASLSKIMATAMLAAVLVERGWLDWDTPISSLLPRYRYQNILLKHLLSHTAGYTAWEPLWEKVRDRFAPLPVSEIEIQKRQEFVKELIFSIEPQSPVEQVALYSDISFILLGFALERAVNMPLDQAVETFVWQPMGIREAFYRRLTQKSSETHRDDIAATENCSWRGQVLQGQVHDDNCWAMGGYAGHAGVFGTIRDVLQFSRMLMLGFLSPRILHRIWTPVSSPPHCSRTLGWDTPSGDAPSAGPRFSKRSVGHLGFTGTSLWIDLDAELAIGLLSNRVHPSRENVKIKVFRPQIYEAVRLDLGR